jgi:hypothetical protein
MVRQVGAADDELSVRFGGHSGAASGLRRRRRSRAGGWVRRR